MVIINFSHPLTDPQKQKVEELAGQPIDRILDLPSQFDEGRPFADEATDLVSATGFSPTDWQTLPLIVNLPSLSVIAALVLAEIHGRAGYFPTILRLRPAAGSAVHQFEVAEILNLQAFRDLARTRRA
jgi:hypothetical protein